MDEKTTITALAALAQEHRLRAFRLLVTVGPDGLPSGQIAERLGVPASTMSAHLAQLERAGLVRSRREQRRIIYGIDVDGMRDVLAFLVEDCCGGRPELCGPALFGRRQDDRDAAGRGKPAASKKMSTIKDDSTAVG
jgi:DNA-binding transcriptional ArsR family regulator